MARAALTNPVKGVHHTSVGEAKRTFVVAPALDTLKSRDAEERFDHAFTRSSKAERKEQREQSIDRIMRNNRAAGL